MKKIIQFFRNKYYRNREMVKYWKTNDAVEAKIVTAKEGHYEMIMQGEKYPFPGFPRGVLLFGELSPLKHQIKNQIFNDTWAELEKPLTPFGEAEWVKHLKTDILDNIYAIYQKGKYNMLPAEKMVPPVKEIWRALTVVEQKTSNPKVRMIKELICMVLQEDDAYRFRFQWMCKFFNPNSLWRKITGRDPIKDFEFGLAMLENAESISDMKERQRLFKRIILFILQDEGIMNCFKLLMKEMDWKKLRLSKADKYFFRAKYFKVDYPEYQY